MSLERDKKLFELEQWLAQAAGRLYPSTAEAIIADEFLEFGASGKVWRKPEIIDAISQWSPIDREVEDFEVRELGDSVCLVTYRSIRKDSSGEQRSSTLRSSIWKRSGKQWQIIFHQGTRST